MKKDAANSPVKTEAQDAVQEKGLMKESNGLSVADETSKQNNLDKDGEREGFNNLSKGVSREVPKKRVPEEHTDSEKNGESEQVVKKENNSEEDRPVIENHRVNTQMDDLTAKLKELDVSKESKSDGVDEFQSRGPTGGKAMPITHSSYGMPNAYQLPSPMQQKGKRSIDIDFEDQYYKYNRPQESVNNYPSNYNLNLLEYTGDKQYQKQPIPELSPQIFGNSFSNTVQGGQFDVDKFLEQAEGILPDVAPLQNTNMGFPMSGYPSEVPPSLGTLTDPSVLAQDFYQGDVNFTQIQKQDKEDLTSDYESTYSPGSVISINSPPPSNQSHDSGYGAPSPASDMVRSPASRIPSGTSPPKDSTTWGDMSSPQSVGPVSPAQTVPDGSKFIDANLETLQDVLNVIGDDIKQDDNLKKQQKQTSLMQQSRPTQMAPQVMMPSIPSPQIMMGPSPPYTSPPHVMASQDAMQPQLQLQTQHASLPSHHAPLPSQHPHLPVRNAQPSLHPAPCPGYTPVQQSTAPPVSSKGQVIILPPATTAMSHPKPIAPMTTQNTPPSTTGSFVIVPGPPNQVNTVSQPVAPVNTSNGPCQIIIVTPQPTQPQSNKKKQQRKILPKVPNGPGDKAAGGDRSNVGSKVMPGKNMSNAVQNERLRQGQERAEQQKKQANLINVARRMVAEISREQLPFQDEEGDTYLHVAVCKTDPNMVKALLERLIREKMHHMIDLPNKHRQTPLYLAVAANQAQMVQMFVERNANPDSMAQVVSPDGKSLEVKAPIHVAASYGVEYLETLKKLLQSPDLNLNIVNSEGHTALHCAILNHGRSKRTGNAQVNSLPIIEALIRAGAEPNSQDKKSGKTPLMYAIEKRDYNLVECMLGMFDPTRLRSIVKSATFDGSSCLRIAEGLKGDYPIEDWQKLWNLLNSAYSGQIMNNLVYNRAF